MKITLPSLTRRRSSALALSALLSISAGVRAQVSYGGQPASFLMKAGSEVSVKRVKAPFKNISRQIARDERAVSETGALPKVGKNIRADYDIRRDGTWETLPDGTLIWRLRVEADGAPALILGYDDFFIPDGARLYLYNDDRSKVLGGYTYETHPQGGPFSTEMTYGPAVTLELVIPAGREDLRDKTRLHVGTVAWCYNHLRLREGRKALRIGESSDCMININSPEGEEWQTEKDGVVRLLMYFDEGIYVCSGTMINNTAEDLTPYLLTAFHCYAGSTGPNLAKWQFYFHYESPYSYDSEPTNEKTLVGCTRKCFTPVDGGSDGMLIELSDQVPEEWGVYFNGWNRRDEPVEGRGVCIHHPAGDLKKISTFDRYYSTQWTGQMGPGAKDAHWGLKFVQTESGWSQVEGGSSGSPLFANDHLVVGTLTGGGGGCDNPNGTNDYGKLWYHWDQYGSTPENQMKTWLDPLSTGADTLRGIYYNPVAPRLVLDKEQLTLDGKVGQDNPSDSIAITAYNLTQPISATVEGVFEVSADQKQWGKQATIGTGGGKLYVRYAPERIGNHTGKLTIQAPEVKRVRYITLQGSSCSDITFAEALPSAEVGEQYSAYLDPKGSEGPYEFKVIEGTWPDGVTMSADGHVGGTIAKDGNYRLLLSVTDKYGCVSTAYTNLYVRCMVVSRMPYVEDFEGTFDADCWKQDALRGDVKWTLGAGSGEDYEDVTTAQSGQHNAIFNDKAYNENTTLLISPQFDFTGYATGKLSFYRLMPAWDTDQDELKVYYRPSAHDDWRELATYNEDTPEWTLTTVELPEVSSEYFIAFGGTGNYGHGIGIDNVTVDYGEVSSVRDASQGAAISLRCAAAEGQLSVEWRGEVTSVAVFDAQGRLIHHAGVAQGATSHTIDTTAWAGGAYVVVAYTQTGEYQQKVLINK